MPQSLVKAYLHIVFSVKNRQPMLRSDLRAELNQYTTEVLKRLSCPLVRIGGIEDHIHILCLQSKTMAIADLLEKVKAPTSKWLKTKGGMLAKFFWQNGYSAFSVSESNAERVAKYIANQETHHRKMTFQEELVALLKKHGVAYDERYLWD